MKTLTEKQQAMLDFIKNSKIPPSRREMADHFGISLTAATERLKTIEKKGYITIARFKSRAITVN